MQRLFSIADHPDVLFWDSKEAAGACRPVGNYTIKGGQVELSLKLKRDGEVLTKTTLTVPAEPIDGLVQQLTDAVVEGCALAE